MHGQWSWSLLTSASVGCERCERGCCDDKGITFFVGQGPTPNVELRRVNERLIKGSNILMILNYL